MLLKISLVLAILVGLATLFYASGNVKSKIDDLTANVASAQAAQKTAEDAQRKASDDAKKSKAALEATTKELTATTNLLVGVSAQLNEQRKRADKASAELTTVTEERNRAQEELNKWTATGIPVEKVRDFVENNKRLETERVALMTENKTLSRKTRELQTELDKYKVPDYEVPLPPGTKGKIVAVDPKYDFVVLDIGSNQGLLPDAKMLVNRDGKLIAKVKITRVEPNRAIANIIPEWKQDDVLEGDQVVY
jgi:hypothetical protein